MNLLPSPSQLHTPPPSYNPLICQRIAVLTTTFILSSKYKKHIHLRSNTRPLYYCLVSLVYYLHWNEMNTIKRSRADSKKKKKITAGVVKAHHAKKKRIELTEKNIQSINPPISSLLNPYTNQIPNHNSTWASINSLDVGNLPLPIFF